MKIAKMRVGDYATIHHPVCYDLRLVAIDLSVGAIFDNQGTQFIVPRCADVSVTCGAAAGSIGVTAIKSSRVKIGFHFPREVVVTNGSESGQPFRATASTNS